MGFYFYTAGKRGVLGTLTWCDACERHISDLRATRAIEEENFSPLACLACLMRYLKNFNDRPIPERIELMNMRFILSYLFFETYATWSSSCKFSKMYSIVHFIAGLWKVQFSNTTGSYWVRQNTVINSRRYQGISAYPKSSENKPL